VICIVCDSTISKRWLKGPKCLRCYSAERYRSLHYQACEACSNQSKQLYAGKCQSCYRSELSPEQQAHLRTQARNYSKKLRATYSLGKYLAKKRNLRWDLSKSEYSDLRNNRCFYCAGDLPPSGIGLDRKDNSKEIGYVISNVVPCCSDCNSIKGDVLTFKETVHVIGELMKFRTRKV
jgi:hypothetical protein